MPFTVQHFLDGASQDTHRKDSHSQTDTSTPDQPPASSPEKNQSPVCRGFCRHTACRTYRPFPQAPRKTFTDTEPTRLDYHTATRIFTLHSKLADLQQSCDTRTQMMALSRANPNAFHAHSRTTRAYITHARGQIYFFERLLGEIKSSAAYFGHIGLPPRDEFVAAVGEADLYAEEVPEQQLRNWEEDAEYLRVVARSQSERIVEEGGYMREEFALRWGVFKPVWNWRRAEEAGVGIEEEVAPEDCGVEVGVRGATGDEQSF